MVENTMEWRVLWGETDAAGIVFYPNYYRWFDQATHVLFRALGYSVAHMLERKFAIPLVEAHARFLGALAYDDQISITSRAAEVRTRSFRIEHTVMRGDSILCEGHEVRIWARLLPGGSGIEALPIPTDVRDLLAASDG